jgi:hypothetical protein
MQRARQRPTEWSSSSGERPVARRAVLLPFDYADTIVTLTTTPPLRPLSTGVKLTRQQSANHTQTIAALRRANTTQHRIDTATIATASRVTIERTSIFSFIISNSHQQSRLERQITCPPKKKKKPPNAKQSRDKAISTEKQRNSIKKHIITSFRCVVKPPPLTVRPSHKHSQKKKKKLTAKDDIVAGLFETCCQNCETI